MSNTDILNINDIIDKDIILLNYYDILRSESDGHMAIEIPNRIPEVPRWTKPMLYYDGEAHALLLRDNTHVIVCTEVHPDVRQWICELDDIIIIENPRRLDIDTHSLPTYGAVVCIQEGISTMADMLIAVHNGK